MNTKKFLSYFNKDNIDKPRFVLEVLAFLILFGGLVIGIQQLKQNAKATKYMYLTGIWNDIMKESIQHPEFNDKSKTLGYSKAFRGDRQRQYESYVRWIGGFIEDLYMNDYEGEGYLYYEPTIETLLDTHSTWFIDHIDYYEHTPKLYERLLDLKNKKADQVIEDIKP